MKGGKRKEKERQNNIQKLGEVIKDKNKIVNDYNKKIHKKIFENVIYLGSQNIETSIYLTDLKVFSFGLLATAIIVFEYSYKKDNGYTAMYGIEILITAILTLFLTYMSSLFVNRIYILILSCVVVVYVVYFIIKSLIIVYKMKKQYFKEKDDIKDIVKN